MTLIRSLSLSLFSPRQSSTHTYRYIINFNITKTKFTKEEEQKKIQFNYADLQIFKEKKRFQKKINIK